MDDNIQRIAHDGAAARVSFEGFRLAGSESRRPARGSPLEPNIDSGEPEIAFVELF